jgi:hypothetical protein
MLCCGFGTYFHFAVAHRYLYAPSYTTFYVLYPIGAGSEAFVTLATVPINTGAKYFGANKWSLDDFARATVFVTWWPCTCRPPVFTAGYSD